jgi:hypothetical protein
MRAAGPEGRTEAEGPLETDEPGARRRDLRGCAIALPGEYWKNQMRRPLSLSLLGLLLKEAGAA